MFTLYCWLLMKNLRGLDEFDADILENLLARTRDILIMSP